MSRGERGRMVATVVATVAATLVAVALIAAAVRQHRLIVEDARISAASQERLGWIRRWEGRLDGEYPTYYQYTEGKLFEAVRGDFDAHSRRLLSGDAVERRTLLHALAAVQFRAGWDAAEYARICRVRGEPDLECAVSAASVLGGNDDE